MSCWRACGDHLRRLRDGSAHGTDDGRRRGWQDSGGIPTARKVCYALGGVPYQTTAAAIAVSLQIFLLDVVQLEASYVSMVLLVSRAWDAVSDPLVGYLVSRSRWTPIGKLTPWLVFSMPFGVLSYVLLWSVPAGWTSQAFRALWFLTAACLFETLMSCYNVPYLSLNMSLWGNQRDRDSATAYRMSVEMLAMLLASVIQGQVVAVYNAEKQEACDQLDAAAPPSGPAASPPPAPLQESQKAFLVSAVVNGAVFFLGCLVLFLGVRERRPGSSGGARRPGEDAQTNRDGAADEARPSYLTSLKMLACHAPYRCLVLGFVLSAFAFQMSLGNFALFCSHAAGQGAHFQHLLLALLVSASAAVPFWQAVLLRIGKRATVFIGLSLFVPAVTMISCLPGNLPVFATMCVLMGFSVATLFLLPWSMLPDVVDDFSRRHPSCKDPTPLLFSCYMFCSKLAGGLAAGISTMTLQLVGYRASACHHGDGVATALTVLFSPVPVTLLLTAMLFFRSYPIDERRRAPELSASDQPVAPPSSPSASADPGEPAECPRAGERSATQRAAGARPARPVNPSRSGGTDGRPGEDVENDGGRQDLRTHRGSELPQRDAPSRSKSSSRSSWV